MVVVVVAVVVVVVVVVAVVVSLWCCRGLRDQLDVAVLGNAWPWRPWHHSAREKWQDFLCSIGWLPGDTATENNGYAVTFVKTPELLQMRWQYCRGKVARNAVVGVLDMELRRE